MGAKRQRQGGAAAEGLNSDGLSVQSLVFKSIWLHNFACESLLSP